MLVALISDIHGRFDALQHAWEAASTKTDRIICLGDVVDGGGDDEQCISFLRERSVPTIRGNHDELWLQLRQHSPPDNLNYRWMAGLPLSLEVESLLLIHDDPRTLDGGPAGSNRPTRISTAEQARQAFLQARVFSGPDAKIVVIGHSHRPAAFSPEGGTSLKPGVATRLNRNSNWLLNPGTVGGTPRSGWGNSWALVDTAENLFTVYPLRLTQQRTLWDDFFERQAQSG